MEENINLIMANVMRLASTVTQLQSSVDALTNETRAIQEAMNNNVSLPNSSSSNTANSKFTVKKKTATWSLVY